MKDLMEQTAMNIREVRELVELEIASEEKFGLETFRYESGIISQLLKELDLCTQQ